MSAVTNLVQSTIGKKVVMATTGLLMVGWLLIHMAGNTLVFAGQEHFNRYAHFIQSGFGIEPALLWLLRGAMLSFIVAHIWAAIGLTNRNRVARPTPYAGGQVTRTTSYAARFMMLGGIVLLTFLVFHLAHLTVGVFSDDGIIQATAFVREDAYRNLVVGLSNPVVGAFYILANLALAAHLHHGVSSGFQTLGLNDPGWNGWKDGLSVLIPALIAGGNILIALAIMAGMVTAPDLSWTAPWTH